MWPYRTRVPFCCFGMTRNVKRGPESTIWVVDPSGRSTYLLMWMCWLAVPFVVSAPFDDKICWYGQAFRINILCNRPILLMDEQLMLGLQNQHSVQLTHFVDGTDNVAKWKFYMCNGCSAIFAAQLALCNVACTHLQRASWAILVHCLFVCWASYVYLSLEQLLCPRDKWKSEKWVGAS